MAEVSIPVTRHVRKVLLAVNGKAEPIHVRHNSLAGKALLGILTDPDEQDEQQPPRYLSSHIKLDISERLLPMFRELETAFQLGGYFEKVFQRMLFTHIEAQVRMGASIQGAISDFYQCYGITEEDYRSDSALKLYQRYRRFTLQGEFIKA